MFQGRTGASCDASRANTRQYHDAIDSDAACNTGPDEANGAGQGAPCDKEMKFFEEQIWQPILSLQCVGCHNASGTAQSTRLVLNHADRLESYQALKDVASEELAGTSLLLLKPTLLHPQGHVGGQLIATDSGKYSALESFVAQVKTDECDAPEEKTDTPCTEVKPGERVLRRLTGREYDNTIKTSSA